MTNAKTGIHDNCNASGFNIQAEPVSITKKTPQRIHAVCKDIEPDARCLSAVRGFAASIFRSIIRLRPIARPRAPIAAIKIQPNWLNVGSPAINAPMNTKGRLNKVCSILTNDGICLKSIFTSPDFQARVEGQIHRLMQGFLGRAS